MKKINLTYNDKGYISNTYDDGEFYIAQQEDKAVIISATFPGNLVGSVNAYVKSGSGGDVIENCGTIDINKHTVELALDSKYLAYNYLKVGFEVKTSTKEIRFEPLTLEVDEFVNVTGSSTPSPYTVSVKVGNVTQLEPDAEPTITNTGTEKHLVLNFGIPKGEEGKVGPKGEPGYTPVKGVDYFTTQEIEEIISPKANAIENSASGEFIQLTDSAETQLKALNVYGKTTQNGTPTPDTPIELNSVDSVDLTISGKNLACVNFSGTHNTGGGVKLTSTDVLSEVIANGTIISSSTASLFEITLKAGTYTLSVYGLNIVDSQYDRIFVRDASTNAVLVNGIRTNEPKSFTITDATTVKIGIILTVGSSYNNQTIKVQLESGSSATEYEPYTANSMSVNTPNGLRGIPVTSGGNYTDSNGQQWVCDEVDFEKGVYIQRTKTIDISTLSWYYNSNYGWHTSPINDGIIWNNIKISSSLCSHFPLHVGSPNNMNDKVFQHPSVYSTTKSYLVIKNSDYDNATDFKNYLTTLSNEGNPVMLCYILAEPIETPLTEEEIAMYKALHTYYPLTNITNGEGAGMSVDYVADTKNYIDNKFAELQNAIISTGGNV